MIFQKMVSQGESFTILAVPFFVAVGVIMNYSGIATRLMNVADMITGRMVGGPAQSNVVLSALMGGVSGSANADAAMEVKMLVPGDDQAQATARASPPVSPQRLPR